MLAQIGIPLGVVHRSGGATTRKRRGGTFSGAVAGADLRPEQDNSTGSASKQKKYRNITHNFNHTETRDSAKSMKLYREIP